MSAPQGAVPPADFSDSDSGDLSLWLALLFAFVGGLILNVMPCVLPILAMKALSLATHGKEGRGESFAYALGAVLSFAVLGLAIVLLRQGGQSVGWGFQLQSPIAVAGFALLVFAVALNLSGLFEVGSITAGESLTQQKRLHRRLLHRRAGGGGGRALHRALHGGGAGLCPDPERAAGAAGLCQPGPWLCAAVPAAGRVAARSGLHAQARPLDADLQAVPGFPHVCRRRLAGLGAGAGSGRAQRGDHSGGLHRAGAGGLAVERDAQQCGHAAASSAWPRRCWFCWAGFMASACCAMRRRRAGGIGHQSGRALHRGEAGVPARLGPPGVCGCHRGLVHHLSGQ